MSENVPPQAPTEPRPADPVTAYATAVVAGQIMAGPFVRAACRRHLKDMETGPGARPLVRRRCGREHDPLLPGADHRKQNHRCRRRRASRVVPFVLQPWQVFIVGSLMGWKNAEGVRRFRRAYVEIAACRRSRFVFSLRQRCDD